MTNHSRIKRANSLKRGAGPLKRGAGVVTFIACLSMLTSTATAAVTFQFDNATIAEGSTEGLIDVLIIVDGADSDLQLSAINLSAGTVPGGTLGGSNGLRLGNPVQPDRNAAIPADPVIATRSDDAFQLLIQAPPGQSFPAAPGMGANDLGPRRLVSVPFTLDMPAVVGQSTMFDFNDPNLPFNNLTDDQGNFRTGSAAFTPIGTIALTGGGITVSAVPEPTSMLVVGVIATSSLMRRRRR